MIHHSHPHCDDCGEQHTPGAPAECIAGLKIRAEQAETDRDAALARAEAAEKRIADGRKAWTTISLISDTIWGHPGNLSGIARLYSNQASARLNEYGGYAAVRVLILDDAEPEPTP